ncbi:MarR family transcriptional regulator [Fulvimarina sp. 2208YS6-2-32]|uniref:MarR family transcriptional regulator n=1 Tax=Fulvimarina uroteuthidis TaxID=3098149 RepID=A0ABU5I279_9HYPH|nr:MarR family transcriptional regulator [Fulvimarina sp. 2208YS6-2-32]MDY8108924.1 MarR family transcriptional regulator [Fulvimarina sp. 2208YS6-2-32]
MNQAPAPTSFPSRPLPEAHAIFIERMGDHMEMEGMPRIAGRLFGLMLVDQGPISFSELAERLNVSRGSISTNARLLESQGLILRVDVAGERQDFFRLADRPFVNMLHGITGHMRETMVTLEECCFDGTQSQGMTGIRATYDFFAEAVDNLEALAKRLAERNGGEIGR